MTQVWDFQVRVNVADSFARAARTNLADPALKPLADVLTRHNATLKNQYDAFADFCARAEAAGETDSVLYKWTKTTIDQPGKEAQYATRFTVYADGGKETYAEAIADAVVADLQPLLASGMLAKVNKISADPAANPQAPSRFMT